MKSYALRDGVGQSAVREIGHALRTHGSGHHWIERFRGRTFINIDTSEDEAILNESFSDVVEAVEGAPR